MQLTTKHFFFNFPYEKDHFFLVNLLGRNYLMEIASNLDEGVSKCDLLLGVCE